MSELRTAAARRTGTASPRVSGRTAGLFWAALTVCIFSGWFVITRFSVTRDLRIWDITALRFGIGALLLAPVLVRNRMRLPRGAWGLGLVFSLLWGVPFVLLVAIGLSLTSAGQAASIAPTLMPLFAGLFAWVFLGEPQGWKRWSGYAAILAGLSLLLLAGGPPSAAGIGALAAAAAMWAVYTLLFRRSGLAPIESAALICFWSALLFLPVYGLGGLSRLGHAGAGEVALQAVYQGVLMGGASIFTFNRAISLLGSSAATAIIALIPAIATLLAIPILGEHPSPIEGVAVAVIVAGVLLAAGQPAPPRVEKEAR
jgi:drug/metabolite transporter (DMT)-like permease